MFQSAYRSPATKVLKADNVLACAQALLAINIETIEDVRAKKPPDVKKALCAVHGIGPATAHMLLMYCGNDDYVKGDVHVCRFVAKALGVEEVSPRLAERLVAGAARGLGIAPRALDVQIWTLGAEENRRR